MAELIVSPVNSLCVRVLTTVAQIITATYSLVGPDPASTDLLMNSDQKAKTKSV